ncbi:MAG: ECF transporter S component [Chloroflexi bacterium]|nr:ECF transporter S component [Chloroflexota bacterium]
MSRTRRERWLNAGILVAATLVGVIAFLSPFFATPEQTAAQSPMAHAQDAPFVLGVLVIICLGAVLANLTAGGMSAKTTAVLGVLTAVSAALRALPGPQGFSAIFFLPILAGYTYGATFGFLLGTLALLTSALLGGGVGPWLPYQMFASGWMGLLSAGLPRRWLRSRPRLEVLILAMWGFLLGLIFGAIMNLWFWPFLFQPGESAIYWQPGMTLAETARRYALFYLVTSLGWDLWRAIGNAVLILVFGRPILRLLRRFQRRFHFDVVPTIVGDQTSASPPAADHSLQARSLSYGPPNHGRPHLPYPLQIAIRRSQGHHERDAGLWRV